MWELWALMCPGPNFGNMCWSRTNGWADLVHLWQVLIYLPWTTPTPARKGSPPPPDGELWGPQLWVLWEGIGQLWAIAVKFGIRIPLTKESCLSNLSSIALQIGELWGHKLPPGPTHRGIIEPRNLGFYGKVLPTLSQRYEGPKRSAILASARFLFHYADSIQSFASSSLLFVFPGVSK